MSVEGYWGHDDYSEGVEISGSFDDVPESLDLDVSASNTNSDSMYWGETYDGESVLIKDGSADFGNAVPANLFLYSVFKDTCVDVPKTGYSEESNLLYIEPLDGLDTSVEGLDQGDKTELLESVAAKALIGDSDFVRNIGYIAEEDSYAVIDPDRAGAPLSSIEDEILDFIESMNRMTSMEVDRSEFMGAVDKVSGEVDQDDLRQSLSELRPLTEDLPFYANFEESFIMDNFRSPEKYLFDDV